MGMNTETLAAITHFIELVELHDRAMSIDEGQFTWALPAEEKTHLQGLCELLTRDALEAWSKVSAAVSEAGFPIQELTAARKDIETCDLEEIERVARVQAETQQRYVRFRRGRGRNLHEAIVAPPGRPLLGSWAQHEARFRHFIAREQRYA